MPVREKEENKIIKIGYLPTKEMLVDGLMKPLIISALEYFKSLLK